MKLGGIGGILLRLIILFLLVFIMFGSTVEAVMAPGTAVIREAQDYGREKTSISLDEFLLPWTAYPEASKRIELQTDRARFYTPYLLVACNARDTAISGKKITLDDSRKVLAEYAGFLVVELTLHGSKAETGAVNAILKQNEKIFPANQLSFGGSEPLRLAKGNIVYTMKYYAYFRDAGIAVNKPVTLSIEMDGQATKVFNFDLAKLK